MIGKRLSTDEFIKRSKLVHGDKYDHSLVEYINYNIKVKIICPEHDLFEQKAEHHLSGQGCSICGKTKKSTTDEFIKKSKLIYGNRYDYSLVNYKNISTKVKIICFIHGEFEQLPSNHLSGYNCIECSKYNKKEKITNTEEFIFCSKIVHNNKYDYSLVNYINCDTKVKIICSKHGMFEQNTGHHMNGNGCSQCVRKKYNTKIFIDDSIKIHKNKYDYSLSKYINAKTPTKIICSKHGVFEQMPCSHLSGQGCKQCGNNTKKTLEQFLKEAKSIHGDKYDYSLVEYINTNTKVKIICPKHGVYLKEPKIHIYSASGCPICKSSVGEKKIERVLENHNIKFLKEYSFIGCRYKQPLRFDFYLPEHNVCVEFDGDQHFVKLDYEEDDNDFKIRQIRDNIKNEYCKMNNIQLIRIRGKQDPNKKLSFLL